ncbi:MAG: ATP-binding protein [Patescibacteria group bacterium]|nr:ATP-binding protein [Patescibacteria group bacterium]
MSKPLTIDIRPPVSVYATYRRLSYRPWYAIAEFVDNATQNYYDHKRGLLKAYKDEGENKITIKIQYIKEERKLLIHDTANGMDFSELRRAVMLNSPPADRTGRSEFGMGLKTAACWFGRKWTVETTRLGSSDKFTVHVDVEEMSHQSNELLNVQISSAKPKEHYTLITISGLYKQINGKTVTRIKDQLSSMYREDLKSGEIGIWYNGSSLSFEEAPIYIENLDDGTEREWKKSVEFEVPWEDEGQTLTVKGWIGIRIPGSQRDAGFVLIRRGRVIIGGPYQGYKPSEIFGQGNTFRSQRLIGELKLDDWPVTQAKDDFDWSGGLEEKFIEILKHDCKDYMDKAEGHRQIREPPTDDEIASASEPAQTVFSSESFSRAITSEVTLPSPPRKPQEEKKDLEKVKSVSKGPQKYLLKVAGTTWEFKLHWQSQISDAHWMELQFPQDNIIDIFLNSAHPFFMEYLNKPGMLELVTKLVLSLALAEKLSRATRNGNLVDPADFRHNMNRVLKYVSEIREESA